MGRQEEDHKHHRRLGKRGDPSTRCDKEEDMPLVVNKRHHSKRQGDQNHPRGMQGGPGYRMLEVGGLDCCFQLELEDERRAGYDADQERSY